MCKHDTTRIITISKQVAVDACIADEIMALNEQGVYTVACCCGHANSEPQALIENKCIFRAREIGYEPTFDTASGFHSIRLKRLN